MSIYRRSLLGALVMGLIASAGSMAQIVTGIGENTVVPNFGTVGTPL